jgi:hypothetical protein
VTSQADRRPAGGTNPVRDVLVLTGFDVVFLPDQHLT